MSIDIDTDTDDSVSLPIHCYSKTYNFNTALKPYIGWTYSDYESDSELTDDEDEVILRDNNNKRIGGIFSYINHNNLEWVTFCNKGYDMGTYCYPSLKIPFKSPMVRWWNLFYCGGYSITSPDYQNYSSKIHIIEDVLHKKKPIGFALIDNDKIPFIIKRIEKAGYPYSIEPHETFPSSFIGICQPLTFGKAFNIKKFLKSYKLFANAAHVTLLNKKDGQFFLSKLDTPLSYWLKDWDYANPVTHQDLALTGLLLGYPIESTVAIMLREME